MRGPGTWMRAVASAGLIWAAAMAQTNAPTIGFVYPAGARVAGRSRVYVAGQFLQDVQGAYIGGGGVEAHLVDYTRPIRGKELNQLRERLAALQKTPRDPNTATEMAQIRRLLAASRVVNPTMAEIVTLDIEVAEQAPLGIRSLRLYTPRGLTNPVNFCIGNLPEYNEPPSTLPQVQSGPVRSGPPVEVEVPLVINGQILPGQVDQYVFQAQAGRVIVAAVRARSLIPYLADAVPGWFQARLALYDQSGAQVAYCDDWRFDPDPVLAYKVQQSGRYTIEIADALFRGREDFVYRLTLGELPWVSDIFPMGGRTGTKTTVRLSGWNLPFAEFTQDSGSLGPGIYGLDLPCINRVLFAVDQWPQSVHPGRGPVRVDVATPQVIHGRMDQPSHVLEFQASKGQVVVAEVYARRLGSPLDAVLRIFDPLGRQIGVCDDCNDPVFGLLTHQADPLVEVTIPEDGLYRLEISDAQANMGPQYAYRLRIGPLVPDFEVIAWPSSLNLRRGDRAILNLKAVRKDGFNGPIRLSLVGNGPLQLEGGLIPEGLSDIRVTIVAKEDAQDVMVPLDLQATATVAGRLIKRSVIATDMRMQAFAYIHPVPADRIVAYLSAGRSQIGRIRLAGPTRLLLRPGAAAAVDLTGPLPVILRQLQLELDQAPQGIQVDQVLPRREGGRVVIRVAGQFNSDCAGNLILRVADRPRQPAEPNAPQRTGGRGRTAYLPAIPFTLTAQ